MVNTFAVKDNIKEYFKRFPYEKVDATPHPGIETRVIFLGEVFTFSEMILNNDPVEAYKQNLFADTKVVYYWGDKTVNLFSLVMSPLNWLSQYLKQSTDEVYYIQN